MREIPIMSKGKNYEVIIDQEDYSKVNGRKWFLNSVGYALTYINGKQVLMHRILVEAPEGKYVDHVNHNTLDNRKRNLRVCTQSENMRNAILKRNNTSGYAGVYKHAKNDVWVAMIKINYKSIYLGGFKLKEDAIKARQQAEDKYFGKFKYQEGAM